MMQRELLRGVLRLNTLAFALATGAICALGIFVATNWLVLGGGHLDESGARVVGPHLVLLSQFFPGYRVSFFGSFIGAAYGLVAGTCIGFVIAWIYNRIALYRRTDPQE